MNNAFDALTKVHDAIGHLQADALKQSSSSILQDGSTNEKQQDGKSLDSSLEVKSSEEAETEKKSEDVKESLERKVEEKKIENKKKSVEISEETENSKKTEMPEKLLNLFGKKGKDKRSGESEKAGDEERVREQVAMATGDLSDEEIRRSVNFLVDFLKEGIEEKKEAKDVKLKDFLASVLRKEDFHDQEKKENKGRSEDKNLKAKKEIEDSALTSKATTGKLKSDEKTTTEEKRKSKKSTINDKASDILKQDTSITKKDNIIAKKKETILDKKDAKIEDREMKVEDKRSREENKKRSQVAEYLKEASTSSRRFEDEVQELVDMILRRKEALKREKLKIRLSDMLREMESSAEKTSSSSFLKRDTEEEGLRKYAEDMLMFGDI